MTPMNNRRFDCIAFQREARARIDERIKDMTPQQEIAYFHHASRTGPRGDWWRRIGDKPNPQAAPSHAPATERP